MNIDGISFPDLPSQGKRGLSVVYRDILYGRCFMQGSPIFLLVFDSLSEYRIFFQRKQTSNSFFSPNSSHYPLPCNGFFFKHIFKYHTHYHHVHHACYSVQSDVLYRLCRILHITFPVNVSAPQHCNLRVKLVAQPFSSNMN